jgi:N-acetylmuramoyl-L-alanine amidase
MLRNPVPYIALLFLLSLSVFITSQTLVRVNSLSQSAAVFFVDNIKPEELVTKYASASKNKNSEKIRIFIMPGHEPDFGGTEYRQIKERELNVIIADYLEEFLEKDSKFDVVVGRNDDFWLSELQTYFNENMDEIKEWKDKQASTMKELVKDGEFELLDDPVPHQKAPDAVALRLYGINKWVGENDFDMALHLHINDYGSRRKSGSGQFTGYTIYVPEAQYSNSAAAKEIAKAVGGRLSQMIAVSDSKREDEGIVEDQNLVALGRFNTADVPSILIEYGYIYEPQFQDSVVTPRILKEYAYQTYLGVKDFFVTHEAATKTKSATSVPYTWDKEVRIGEEYSLDVLALQVALWTKGMYPPLGKDLRSCPITGIFGGCTKGALDEFQKKNLIEGESGRLGDNTRAILDSTFRK